MIHTQILIIGQGLAGSLLAWELWKHGVDFRVMDPGLPDTASKAAAGMFHPLVARKIRQTDRFDLLFPALKNTYLELEMQLENKFLFETPTARLILPQTMPEWKKAMQNELKDHILQIIPAGGFPGLNPGKAVVLTTNSGFVEVPGLVYALSRWFRGKGLLIEQKLNYSKISLHAGSVRVGDKLSTECIVFCEGPGALNNPWFKEYGISANKGEVLEILAPELEEQYILRDEVFILPLDQGRFRVGATYSQQSLDNEPTKQGLQELKEKLNRMLKVTYDVVDHWAGVRPVSKDRIPILGFHPLHPQLAIFNGLGSRGVIQAPYWASQMRKLLTEDSFVLPKEVLVDRFFNTL